MKENNKNLVTGNNTTFLGLLLQCLSLGVVSVFLGLNLSQSSRDLGLGSLERSLSLNSSSLLGLGSILSSNGISLTSLGRVLSSNSVSLTSLGGGLSSDSISLTSLGSSLFLDGIILTGLGVSLGSNGSFLRSLGVSLLPLGLSEGSGGFSISLGGGIEGILDSLELVLSLSNLGRVVSLGSIHQTVPVDFVLVEEKVGKRDLLGALVFSKSTSLTERRPHLKDSMSLIEGLQKTVSLHLIKSISGSLGVIDDLSLLDVVPDALSQLASLLSFLSNINLPNGIEEPHSLLLVGQFAQFSELGFIVSSIEHGLEMGGHDFLLKNNEKKKRMSLHGLRMYP